MTLYVDGDAFPNLLKPILVYAIGITDAQSFVNWFNDFLIKYVK